MNRRLFLKITTALAALHGLPNIGLAAGDSNTELYTNKIPTVLVDHEAGPVLKVVGIGGAGNNIINNLITAGAKEVEDVSIEFIAIDTDPAALARSKADIQFQLGDLGTSCAWPDIARITAWQERELIGKHLVGANMVCVVAGFGGGTGSGATHVITKLAKQSGALTIVLAATPEDSEIREVRFAEKAYKRVMQQSGNVITFSNNMNPMSKNCHGSNFQSTNSAIEKCIEGLVLGATCHSLIGLDLADIRTVFSNEGRGRFGWGMGYGKQRTKEAAADAIAHPSLGGRLDLANGVYISILANKLLLAEISQILDITKQSMHPDATLIVGAFHDNRMKEGAMQVNVLAMDDL